MDEQSPKCCRLPPNLFAASRETSKTERRVLNGTLELRDSALRQYQRVQSNAWLRRAMCYRANLARAQPLSLSTCCARVVGLSLVSGWLLVRTVKHLRQPSSQVPENSGDGWRRQESIPKWLFCRQRISQFENRGTAEFAVVTRIPAVLHGFIKLGGGRVNSPFGERDSETFHRRQGPGDAFSGAIKVELRHCYSGICFPRERLPGALCGSQCGAEEPVRFDPRRGQ